MFVVQYIISFQGNGAKAYKSTIIIVHRLAATLANYIHRAICGFQSDIPCAC